MSTTAETALAAETAPPDSASPASPPKSQTPPAGRSARAPVSEALAEERNDHTVASSAKKAVPAPPAVKTLSLERPFERRPLPARQRRPTPTRPLSTAEQDYLADYERRERCRKECGIVISAFASILVKLCMHRYEGHGQTLEEYEYNVLHALRCRYEEGRLAHFGLSKPENKQSTQDVASVGRVTRYRGDAEAETMAKGVLAEHHIKANLESQGLLVTQTPHQRFSRAVNEALNRARHLRGPVYLAPQSLESAPFLDEFGDQGYNTVKFGRFVPDLIEFKPVRGGEVVWSVIEIKFTYGDVVQKTRYENVQVQAGFYHLNLLHHLANFFDLEPSGFVQLWISKDCHASEPTLKRSLHWGEIEENVTWNLFEKLPMWLGTTTASETEWVGKARRQEPLRGDPPKRAQMKDPRTFRKVERVRDDSGLEAVAAAVERFRRLEL